MICACALLPTSFADVGFFARTERFVSPQTVCAETPQQLPAAGRQHSRPVYGNGIYAERSPRKEKHMKRIGVVGIVLKGERDTVLEMQKVLSDFSDIIVGRMGVPREEANAIALIVEGTQERISALTGRLGKFPTLAVKSAVTAFEVSE